MTDHPIGPQRATPASPAKIQAEVDQARRAMADSLKVGDVIESRRHDSTWRALNAGALDVARSLVISGWTKLETKGGE